MIRGIYPILATITADGWSTVGDAELAERYRDIIASAGEGIER
jgi:hypothetical protein